jgi:hypothetical protein
MEPEPLPRPDSAPSLAERVGTAWGGHARGVIDPTAARRTGLMLALLLPVGPLLTIGAAESMAWRERTAATTLAESGTARIARAKAAETAELARLGPASLADTVERIARVLPPESRLVSLDLNRGEDGAARLSAQVATADPDRLRAALGRDAVTARLRSTSERKGDGVLIVTLEPDS